MSRPEEPPRREEGAVPNLTESPRPQKGKGRSRISGRTVLSAYRSEVIYLISTRDRLNQYYFQEDADQPPQPRSPTFEANPQTNQPQAPLNDDERLKQVIEPLLTRVVRRVLGEGEAGAHAARAKIPARGRQRSQLADDLEREKAQDLSEDRNQFLVSLAVDAIYTRYN
jgi:hypothetical protein